MLLLTRVVALAAALACTSPVLAAPVLIKVDPAAGTPTSTRPDGLVVASVEAAVDLAAGERARGNDVVIELAAGIHRLHRTIKFTKAHSGTREAPLVIRAAAGARAFLVGSRLLPAHPAQSPTPNPASSAAGTLLQVDLPDDVLQALHTETPRGFPLPQTAAPAEFFVGGRRLVPARWPDTGYYESEAVGREQAKPIISVPAAEVAKWKDDADQIWVAGYWGFDWHFETAPLRDLDATAGTITLAPLSGPYKVQARPRFFIYNAKSELDAPGEYYLDRKARRLEYFAPNDASAAREVEVPRLDTLVTFDGVSDVRFENVGLAYSLGDALTVTNSKNITFSGCFLGHTGSRGALVRGGEAVVFSRCVIADTGETGIDLIGGNRTQLQPSRHTVEDSLMTHYGETLKTYRPAIKLAGVGQIVKNTLMIHGPHFAIWFQGNDHQIIGNEFADNTTETLDSGAIMCGRDWSARGLEISHNLFRNGHPYSHRDFGTPAIYLDDFISGEIIEKNVFYDYDMGVFINGGRDNRVLDNVFLKIARSPIEVQNLASSKHAQNMSKPDSMLQKNLNAVPWSGTLWLSKYPDMRLQSQDTYAPFNTRVEGNISDSEPLVVFKHEAEPFVAQEGNTILSASGLKDFKLPPDVGPAGVAPYIAALLHGQRPQQAFLVQRDRLDLLPFYDQAEPFLR